MQYIQRFVGRKSIHLDDYLHNRRLKELETAK
jgi:hypothetical protein